MKDRNLELIGLCETRVKEGRKVLHDDYHLIYKGCDEGRGGVAYILSPQLAKRVDSIVYKSERIVAITLKLCPLRVSVIQIYVPQQRRPQVEKDEFHENLQDILENVKYTDNIILMGD